MEQNKPHMIKNNIETLFNEKGLTFLLKTTYLNDAIRNKVKTIVEQGNNLKNYNIAEDNCYYMPDGTEVYLNSNDWNMIYAMITKTYRVNDESNNAIDDDSLTPSAKHEINLYDSLIKEIKPATKEKISLRYILKKIIKDIVNSSDTKKPYLNIIKTLVVNEQKSVVHLLEKKLINIIMTTFYRKEDLISEDITSIHGIKETQLMLESGHTLFIYYLTLNPFFNRLLHLKDKTKKNIKMNITDTDIIIKILIALKNNDKIGLKAIYSILNFIEINNTFIDILNCYLLDLLYTAKEQNNLKDLTICNLLETLLKTKKDVTNELQQYKLQIGAPIVDLLIKNEVFKKVTSKKDFYKKGKQQNRLIISQMLLEHLTEFHYVNKPYLTESNLEYIEANKSDILYAIIASNSDQFERHHHQINLTIKEKSYLTDYKPHTKFSVDKMYFNYILDFITYIKEFNYDNNNMDPQNYQTYLSAFLSMYDIDFLSLLNLINKKYENEEYKLKIIQTQLGRICTWSMDMDKINSNELLEEFKKEINHTFSKTFQKLLNKVMQHKIIIMGAIKECYIYSNFKYFINPSFIDSRGRLYNASIFTNIQLFPITKSFIKLFQYRPQIYYSKIQFEDLKCAVKETLITSKYKEQIMTLDYNTYQYKEKQLLLVYIYTYFNKNLISYEQLCSTIENTYDKENLLSFIISNIKIHKKILYVHSWILQYQMQQNNTYNGYLKYLSTYYELDASASGLQMLSILFNDELMARMSNLIGEEQQDIYTQACTHFKSNLQNAFDISSVIISRMSVKSSLKKNSIVLNIIDNTLLEKSFSDKISTFMQLNLKKTAKNMAVKSFMQELILDIRKQDDLFNLLLNLNIPDWLQQDNENAFIKRHAKVINKVTMNIKDIQNQNKEKIKQDNKIIIQENVKVIKSLLFIKEMLYIEQTLVEKHPWIQQKLIFDQRDFFKNAIMTYFYNSTSFRRKENFMKFFEEYSEEDLSFDSNIIHLVAFVEKWFVHYIKQRFVANKKMNDLSKSLSLCNKNIIISNKHFYIVIDPSTITKKKIQTTSSVSKRGSQLTLIQKSNKKDPKIICQKFSPNMIHSMDAMITHNFIERCININKKLSIKIAFTTNHDNFYISCPLILRITLKDCYQELIDSEYLYTLKDNNSETFSIENFITNKEKIADLFKEFNDFFVK